MSDQRSRFFVANAGSSRKLTSLEEEFLRLKEKYPYALLLIEVGYKFRFFEDDAEVNPPLRFHGRFY